MDFKIAKHWPAYAMGLVVAAIFVLATVSFQVAEFEHAVLIRLGKPQKELYKPGLHLKWPYPVDRIWKADNRLRTFGGNEGRLEETQTADAKNITVSIAVNWRISDPITFIERLRSIERAEFEINALMRSAKNAVIGRYRLNQLVNTDRKKLKLEQVESDMLKLVRSQAVNYGIDVVSAGLQHLGFPQDVAASVFERMRAERKRLAERYLGEGRGEAERIKAEAGAKASEIIAEAEAQAKMTRAEGDAAAVEYYKVFKQSPELATLLRKLDALKKSVDKKTTLVLDTDTVPFDLLGKRAKNSTVLKSKSARKRK